MIESSMSTIRTGIVVCACCDAPTEFLEQPDVIIIPIPIKIGNNTYIDYNNSQDHARFFREISQKQRYYGKSVTDECRANAGVFLKTLRLGF